MSNPKLNRPAQFWVFTALGKSAMKRETLKRNNAYSSTS